MLKKITDITSDDIREVFFDAMFGGYANPKAKKSLYPTFPAQKP